MKAHQHVLMPKIKELLHWRHYLDAISLLQVVRQDCLDRYTKHVNNRSSHQFQNNKITITSDDNEYGNDATTTPHSKHTSNNRHHVDPNEDSDEKDRVRRRPQGGGAGAAVREDYECDAAAAGIHEDDGDRLRQELIEIMMLEAHALEDHGDFSNALFVVKEVLGINGSCLSALRCASVLAFELKKNKEAKEYANRILQHTSLFPASGHGVCSNSEEMDLGGLSGNYITHAKTVLAQCSLVEGDPSAAASLFVEALQEDSLCTTAMHFLIDRYLLPPQELHELISSLPLPEGCESVRKSYLARMKWVPMSSKTNADDMARLWEGVSLPLQLTQQSILQRAKNNLREARDLAAEARKYAPHSKEALCAELGALVDMKSVPDLFAICSQLSSASPSSPLTLYSIGCYYYCLGNYERAGRFFGKVTDLDPQCFPEAWIAFGHCFAALEEGEQALSVYNRAFHKFPGLYLCTAYIGMQYSRVHTFARAMSMLQQSRVLAPTDPLVLNEMAVLYVNTQQIENALPLFEEAYRNLPNHANPSEYEDCIVFNLATVYRKVGDYNKALDMFRSYSRLRPKSSQGHVALGFVYHLMGNLKMAIASYHVALSYKADVFCRGMLDRALREEYGGGPIGGNLVGGSSWGGGDNGVSGSVFSPGGSNSDPMRVTGATSFSQYNASMSTLKTNASSMSPVDPMGDTTMMRMSGGHHHHHTSGSSASHNQQQQQQQQHQMNSGMRSRSIPLPPDFDGVSPSPGQGGGGGGNSLF